jgi:hypothetical protein
MLCNVTFTPSPWTCAHRLVLGDTTTISQQTCHWSQRVSLTLFRLSQPCTVRDFMNYLKYIELAAENLQFFLWHKDYSNRFDALPESEKKLSPEWTMDQAEAEALAAQAQPRSRANKVSPETAAVFRGTEFESQPRIADAEKGNPFYTPPRTPSSDTKREESKSLEHSSYTSKSTFQKKAEGAFEDAGLKWQPCTSQSLSILMSSEPSANRLFSLNSHRPAVSGGDLAHHHNLHRRRRFTPAQFVFSRAHCPAARSGEHNSSFSIP